MADIFTESLSKIIKFARINFVLHRGLHEVIKALESDSKPLFVVLAEDCDN